MSDLYSWSSFENDKGVIDSWRKFLKEASKTSPGRSPKPVPKPEEETPPETPSEEAPEAPPEGDAPEGDAPEGGGGRGAAAKKALGKFGKMFYKKPGEFLPSMKSDWKGVGKFNLGSTSGQKARRQLALMGDIDLSGVKGRQAAAAATDSAGSAAKGVEDSASYKKFKGYVIDVVNDRNPDPIKIQQAYKSLSDEQKEEFKNFLDEKALDNPKMISYFTAALGSIMEQFNLSLEDLIKEELLRVLNEEE